MEIIVLLLVVLSVVSAVVVVWVVFNRRRRIEEKEQSKAQEEQRREVEQAELKRLEAERQQLQERERKVEDECCKAEGADGTERPPPKGGGRPRGSTVDIEIGGTSEAEPHSLKPEIVCWNEGRNWVVGIEVPEELEVQSLVQNEELLEQDKRDETRYCLNHAEGTVKVTWIGGEKDIPLVEKGRDYFIFKMRKNWKEPGRLVRCSTAGYYLVVVPRGWKRDEAVSGTAPVVPENVQLNGYVAHFFYQEQSRDTLIGFITANGERIQVESGTPCFQFVGREIGDASEDMGPLFGGEPPFIQTLDEKGWSDIRIIVVGEEGSGRNRWRTSFAPQEGAKEQRMPDEIVNRQGGWYFVRIYDDNNDLLESIDFRFSAGLKDIQIMNSGCLPESDGYSDITVRFLLQANCKVELEDKEIHHSLTIRRESDSTILTIPPVPNYDKTHWILRDGNAKVKVTVLVERVWWCVDSLDAVPTNWTDKTISLSRKDFTAITDKALWVRFPRKRWISKIEVGFERTKSRYYNVETEKEEIAIPLRDFCDAKEIENKQEEFTMKIWVSPEETKIYEAIVLKIPVELSRPVEPKPPQVKPPPLLKLESEVKSPRGKGRKRKGKGFSRNEIGNAGLTMEDVKRLHIPYDRRRKSSHLWNIKRLNL